MISSRAAGRGEANGGGWGEGRGWRWRAPSPVPAEKLFSGGGGVPSQARPQARGNAYASRPSISFSPRERFRGRSSGDSCVGADSARPGEGRGERRGRGSPSDNAGTRNQNCLRISERFAHRLRNVLEIHLASFTRMQSLLLFLERLGKRSWRSFFVAFRVASRGWKAGSGKGGFIFGSICL